MNAPSQWRKDVADGLRYGSRVLLQPPSHYEVLDCALNMLNTKHSSTNANLSIWRKGSSINRIIEAQRANLNAIIELIAKYSSPKTLKTFK